MSSACASPSLGYMVSSSMSGSWYHATACLLFRHRWAMLSDFFPMLNPSTRSQELVNLGWISKGMEVVLFYRTSRHWRIQSPAPIHTYAYGKPSFSRDLPATQACSLARPDIQAIYHLVTDRRPSSQARGKSLRICFPFWVIPPQSLPWTSTDWLRLLSRKMLIILSSPYV
jgi:hypothetical protein